MVNVATTVDGVTFSELSLWLFPLICALVLLLVVVLLCGCFDNDDDLKRPSKHESKPSIVAVTVTSQHYITPRAFQEKSARKQRVWFKLPPTYKELHSSASEAEPSPDVNQAPSLTLSSVAADNSIPSVHGPCGGRSPAPTNENQHPNLSLISVPSERTVPSPPKYTTESVLSVTAPTEPE